MVYKGIEGKVSVPYNQSNKYSSIGRYNHHNSSYKSNPKNYKSKKSGYKSNRLPYGRKALCNHLILF